MCPTYPFCLEHITRHDVMWLCFLGSFVLFISCAMLLILVGKPEQFRLYRKVLGGQWWGVEVNGETSWSNDPDTFAKYAAVIFDETKKTALHMEEW